MKKSGVIKREEQVEQRETDVKYTRAKRIKQRMVKVGGYFNVFTGVKPNETDQEAVTRYRNKHRNEFEREDGSIVPIKYRK